MKWVYFVVFIVTATAALHHNEAHEDPWVFLALIVIAVLFEVLCFRRFFADREYKRAQRAATEDFNKVSW